MTFHFTDRLLIMHYFVFLVSGQLSVYKKEKEEVGGMFLLHFFSLKYELLLFSLGWELHHLGGVIAF